MIPAFQSTPQHKQGQELRSEQTVAPLHEQSPATYFLRLNNLETFVENEVVQFRSLRHGHVQSILDPSAVNGDHSPIPEQQLHAAGSCWEGVDFPGDMVSSLIIVKLPFAVPDPISEAQKKEYASLKDYIQAVIVPDMQKKLRQGFGRALRTETDTCVVSILDERAGEGGRYHEEVMCALPSCKMAKDIKDVQHFIRNRKGVEYYL